MNSNWPSFIIQGVVLLTGTSVLDKSGISEEWILLSIALILLIFALQVTSHRFIYLFPVNQTNGKDTTYIDTHIVRILLLFSIFSLLVGMLELHRDPLPFFIGLAVFMGVPLAFNFIFNKKIKIKIKNKQ